MPIPSAMGLVALLLLYIGMQHTLYFVVPWKDLFAAPFATASPLWVDGEKASTGEEHMKERVYV